MNQIVRRIDKNVNVHVCGGQRIMVNTHNQRKQALLFSLLNNGSCVFYVVLTLLECKIIQCYIAEIKYNIIFVRRLFTKMIINHFFPVQFSAKDFYLCLSNDFFPIGKTLHLQR